MAAAWLSSMISSLRLDHPGVEHELLAVDDGQPLPLHLEQERRLDDVDADGLVGHAGLDEQRLDLGHGVGGGMGKDMW